MTKLWGYFVPVPPKATTKRALERLYVSSGYEVRPVVEAILRHPALYEGPRMVKPPAIYLAGLLRALKRGIDTDGLDVADEPGRPAALLPAERRGLGRRPLARHGHLPGALDDRRRTRSGRTC